ncbi:uncharacterized protein LOC110030715 [Phalaenopsis equestris]|uniref:uncharacterized protein LOC110030715 n=1 Tax=Phalaenopsis equestris TaxID=78828 RepID=UPI0009E36757|nr:uncharacterized protein LOC110030715 [Phalaenopsis equestris]
MGRLSALRRYSVPWPSSIWRLPEAPDGLLSDKSGQLITQARPCFPPHRLPAAAETIGHRAFESSRPFASCFRSPTMPYSSASFFPSLVFGRRTDYKVLTLRRYSTINERDDSALEEEVERKAGWLLKAIFVVTAVGVASQFFPYGIMYSGDNLLQQSISLLHVKDPLFKRMGASRLRRFAIDDERRMKVVEMGGAQDLLIMLEGAKDDKTRKEALKALLALSHSDAVAEILQQANAAIIVASAPDSSEFDEIGNCKSSLLKRLREFQKLH